MSIKTMPGFMLYFTDWDMPRQILDAETFKQFFDAVFCYARDGEIPPEFGNQTAQVFFDGFKEKINLDVERYQDRCRKASEAAKKSHANANERQQTQANAANTKTNNNLNKYQNQNQNDYQTQNQNDYQYQTQNQNEPQRTLTYGQQMALRRGIDDEDLPF